MAEVAASSPLYQKSPLDTLVRQSSRRVQNSPRLLNVGTSHRNEQQAYAAPPTSPLLHTRFETTASTSGDAASQSGEDDTTSSFGRRPWPSGEDSESNYSSGPESPYAETGFQYAVDPSNSYSRSSQPLSTPNRHVSPDTEADRLSWASDGSQSTVRLNSYVPHARDTWRSSANSVDPFAYRRFESPTKDMEVPHLIVTSPTRSLPRSSVIEADAISLESPIVTRSAPSVTQYNLSNFSRPIRSHAASDEKSKWQVLERNRSQSGTNPVHRQVAEGANQNHRLADNGRSPSPHNYQQQFVNNAVPSGSSHQPYHPAGNQTKLASPTNNLTMPGRAEYDSRATQSTAGYSQPYAYPQHNPGYSPSSPGYPQANAGYSYSNAGNPQYNAGYSQFSAGYTHERSPPPPQSPPSNMNMQEKSRSPNSFVVVNPDSRLYPSSPLSPPPPFPPPSVPVAPSYADNNIMSPSPVSPPTRKETLRLPGAPPQFRPPSKLSLYSTYSFYQLDDDSRTPSPSSPQPAQQAFSPSAPNPQNTGNTLTVDYQSRRSPRASPSPSTSPTPEPPYPQQQQQQQQQTSSPTAEDYLFMGIQHHEGNRLAESARCFQLAATLNGGCGVGMLMWGLALRHAWGAQKDEKTAFMWLRRAAEAAVGDLEAAREGKESVAVQAELVLAIYEVGQCFFHGWGVPQDKKMAVSYFQVAARLGDMDAQQELAFCLANGKGCKKNLKEAAKWYRAAAEQGASTVGLAWIYKSKYS